ncbi:torsin-1A-interacting protein 1-like [Montipora foliosa]|uniref:torsin-1A-interacting protein 1-like n=1 Tax=Montipora foliosa TaxID=591990 RepID=UPI0035F18163
MRKRNEWLPSSVFYCAKMASEGHTSNKNITNEANVKATASSDEGGETTQSSDLENMKGSRVKGDGPESNSTDATGNSSEEENNFYENPVKLSPRASQVCSEKESHITKDSKPDARPGQLPSEAERLSDIYKGVAFLVLATLVLAIAFFIGPPQPEVKNDLDFVKIFESKLSILQSSFTNQTDRFWRILKNRGLAHLRSLEPRQPLVLLLAAPPSAHDVVNCLATKLAELLDPRNKRNLAQVDGFKEKSNLGEEVKKAMDDLLEKKFKKGHRAALIQHLELLPPPSPLLFYSYCDDQNAPHKQVAIIFTVHLPKEPDLSLSAKEAEGAVETYLSDDVWVKEDQDAVAALLSRVADTVALMNGESSELVRTLCSN